MKKNIFLIFAGLILVMLMSFRSYHNISAQTATLTATPTPNPEEAATPPTIGTADYCESLTISTSTLSSGGSLTITAKAKNSNIKTFSYRFYNTDNANKTIKFKVGTATPDYTRTIANAFTSNTNTITVNFSQMDRNDMNWASEVYGNPKPKNIKVAAYFTDLNNITSKNDTKCEVTFVSKSIDPTPTPNSLCTCSTANVCNATYCKFDRFPTPTGTGPAFTYPAALNCGYSNFQSAPTVDQKNAWCRSYYRTKGDANGDGKANLFDYFYYVAARSGAKVPANVMPDFNGDNFISDIDRNIIIKSLKQ